MHTLEMRHSLQDMEMTYRANPRGDTRGNSLCPSGPFICRGCSLLPHSCRWGAIPPSIHRVTCGENQAQVPVRTCLWKPYASSSNNLQDDLTDFYAFFLYFYYEWQNIAAFFCKRFVNYTPTPQTLSQSSSAFPCCTVSPWILTMCKGYCKLPRPPAFFHLFLLN